MMLFDSHCHFDFPDFDEDRADIWQGCLSSDIHKLIIPGVDQHQWHRALALTESYKNMYFSVGFHPMFLDEVARESPELLLSTTSTKALIKHPKCVAIGECGLDKRISLPIEDQIKLTSLHIDIANEHSLPVIVHCVTAHNELIVLLKKHKPKAGGVVHAFSGSYETAMQLIDCGLHLGIGGTITYHRAKKTRDAAARIPLERTLLETDAPDMPLSGKQGERNSPSNLILVAQAFAELRGETLNTIARVTTENATRLFKV